MREGLEPRDQALLSALAYAGLRPQEALALRWEEVGERALHVARKNTYGAILPYTKTRTERHVRLLIPLVEDLTDWQRKSGVGRGLLFPRYDGKAFTETDYRNWRRRRYEPAARRAGLTDSRPYDLRATWVSLMIFEGAHRRRGRAAGRPLRGDMPAPLRAGLRGVRPRRTHRRGGPDPCSARGDRR